MKVLIVEDDSTTALMLKEGLEAGSHVVEVAGDGADGSFLARSYDYDAVVLDYSLPKKDGLLACREIRAAGKSTPIMFLSVVGANQTKVAALDSGADDYMTKPFSFDEFSARLRAITRRPAVLKPDRLSIDNLEIDVDKQKVERAGKPIYLTRKEFSLLEYLVRHRGIVMSRSAIMEYVWTAENDPFSNTVEAHIRNIRRKINAYGPNLIVNVTGRGYLIDIPENLSSF